MPRSPVCVDANIVVKIVVPEPDRPLALSLWNRWLKEEREIIAPYLLAFEVASAIWRKAVRRFISADEARESLKKALDLGVQLLHPPGLPFKAFDLAARFNRPTTYDAHYLALAEMMDCEFWTADERLYNAIKDGFPLIRWLGDYEGES